MTYVIFLKVTKFGEQVKAFLRYLAKPSRGGGGGDSPPVQICLNVMRNDWSFSNGRPEQSQVAYKISFHHYHHHILILIMRLQNPKVIKI